MNILACIAMQGIIWGSLVFCGLAGQAPHKYRSSAASHHGHGHLGDTHSREARHPRHTESLSAMRKDSVNIDLEIQSSGESREWVDHDVSAFSDNVHEHVHEQATSQTIWNGNYILV